MKIYIKSTTVPYANSSARVIITSTDEQEPVKVYLPDHCKLVAERHHNGVSHILPTWRSDGVLNERLSSVIASVFGGNEREWLQADDHAPAAYLNELVTALDVKPFLLTIEEGVVTLHPQVGTVVENLRALRESVKCLGKCYGMEEVKAVNILGVADHPENDGKSDCVAQLEQATNIVNDVFSDTVLDNAIVTMSDVGGDINLPDFADIMIDASVNDEVVITLSFKHQRHYAAIDARKSHEITQAIVAVVRHILGDNSFATQAAVKLEVLPMEQKERKPKSSPSSILDITHKPDMRFKLPVTPVVYNYTNAVIEIEGARVVPHNRHFRLQDSQFEGDPIIGVILDFSHPVAGLHDLRAVRNKNPNIPVYILWNSDKGVELELYND